METVTSSDGTRIAYDTTGDGPPLVLLHGGGAHHFWEPLVPAFAEEFTVVRPDRRAHGASGDHEDYSIAKEVADVQAVVDTLEADPVLFGHSFGGLQAIEAARELSVRAVVAYEPAYLCMPYREQADLADEVERALEAEGPRAAMKIQLREVLNADAFEDFEAFLAEWPGWPAAAESVEETLRMDRALEQHELPESPDIDAPALLLTGSRGPPHLRDSVRAVDDALADSRLVEFDGVSHLGPAEAPERTTEAVLSFLQEQTALPA